MVSEVFPALLHTPKPIWSGQLTGREVSLVDLGDSLIAAVRFGEVDVDLPMQHSVQHGLFSSSLACGPVPEVEVSGNRKTRMSRSTLADISLPACIC